MPALTRVVIARVMKYVTIIYNKLGNVRIRQYCGSILYLLIFLITLTFVTRRDISLSRETGLWSGFQEIRIRISGGSNTSLPQNAQIGPETHPVCCPIVTGESLLRDRVIETCSWPSNSICRWSYECSSIYIHSVICFHRAVPTQCVHFSYDSHNRKLLSV